jgi:hypothetical protein
MVLGYISKARSDTTRQRLDSGVQFVDLNDDQQEKLGELLTGALESGPDKDAMTVDLVEE